ncbi:hypothetical protein BCAR13_1840011 [Paraburkholderia caribensis]|nr:hypothetical protein BCAR13_1840011 [Paraburkholderia caribensis]
MNLIAKCPDRTRPPWTSCAALTRLPRVCFLFASWDDFVPALHPLRAIRVMANKALAMMDRLFAGMYGADVLTRA